jgi:hypothetical protein
LLLAETTMAAANNSLARNNRRVFKSAAKDHISVRVPRF